jgi:glycosyltransferase involved in cell wall biosynthesis
MRVLQVHKFFYPHAGSETVLFHTRDLLMDRGHDVVDFAMKHPDNRGSEFASFFPPRREYTDSSRNTLPRGRDALASVYSLAVRRRLRALVSHTKPDVAQLHSVYHQLTMSVVDELAQMSIPMVMTLHDYKIGCPAYILYRNGRPCHDCTTGAAHNAVRHRCIKNAWVPSILAGIEATLVHKTRKYDKIGSFVCPSAFAASVALEAGIPGERLRVVPNFLPDAEIGGPVSSLAERARFFFAGRLEEVKGVNDLLSAFDGGDPSMGTLVIAGAGGELEARVRELASRAPNIEYVGRLTRDEVAQQLRNARAVVLPSRWEENNPMSILEARALGIPVIVSAMGGLPEMVTDDLDGKIVEVGNIANIREAVGTLATDRELAQQLGRNGYARLCRDNTASVHYRGLMDAYLAAGARATQGAHAITAIGG